MRLRCIKYKTCKLHIDSLNCCPWDILGHVCIYIWTYSAYDPWRENDIKKTVQKSLHLKLPRSSKMRQFCPEGVFLNVSGAKNCKTFAPCYSQPHPPTDFAALYTVFFNLRFLHQQLKVGGSLALFTLSLTFESCIVLSLINLYFYMNTSFPLRNNI